MNNSPSHTPPPYYDDDEITLKELILKLQEFWKEAWNNKIWIILTTSILAGIFLGKTYLDKTTYTSSLTFLVSGNGDKNGGELASVLGYGVINYELDKIVELARSRSIINKVLLKKIVLDGKDDFLANHLIELYNYQEDWKEEAKNSLYEELKLNDFFFTHDKVTDFVPKEHRAINLLNELVAGNNFKGKKGLITINYDKKTEIVRISVMTNQAAIAVELLDAIYKELSHFYIEESIGRPRRTFKILAERADSLLRTLEAQEYQLAKASDRNLNVYSRTSNLGLDQLARKLQTTTRLYEEVLSNKEKVEYVISSETPEFQVIDRTFLPIKDAPSKLKALIIGAFLGSFLSIAYIIGRKIIRERVEVMCFGFTGRNTINSKY